MLANVRRLGLAVSGGSDSVALLRLLLPLCRAAGVAPVVLHVDHGLRGAASAADARFVARLAKRLGLECRVAGLPGPGKPSDPVTSRPSPASQSLEMAARAARQQFFREAKKQCGLDAIATGHTADDVAETLLLRLARGSGAAGLSGLRPVHAVAGVKYVRPLLECSHAELRAWLRRKRQGWREDASNRDEAIPRNRLRHAVLPWLERHWSPSIRGMLVQSASILRDEDALLEDLARQELRIALPSGGSGLELSDRFSALPLALQRRMIRQWLIEAGHPEAAGWRDVEGVLARLRIGAAWQATLSGGLRVRAKDGVLQRVDPPVAGTDGNAGLPVAKGSPRVPSRGRARARSGAVSVPCHSAELALPGRVDVAGVRVTTRLAKGIVRTAGPVGALPSSCTLDAAALRGRVLLVRTRRPGDRIRPLGLAGTKALQDLFVDAKVPAAQRDQLPLLVVDDEVVWVPGYRVARTFAVRGARAAAVRVDMQVKGP